MSARRAGVVVADLGSSFSKAHIVGHDGTVVWSSRAPAPISFRGPFATQDVTLTLEQLASMLRSAPIRDWDLEAVIATGQMGGYVPVGGDGRVLGPLETYLDTRATQYGHSVMARHAELVWRCNGGNPCAAPKIGRAVSSGDLPKGTRRLVAASSVPAMAWCALDSDAAFTDRTQAWMWGLYDAQQGCWDGALCDLFGVPAHLLPSILEPWTFVGRLARSSAQELGLPSGLPVLAGAGDGMVGWFGAGAARPGDAIDTGGTTSHLGIAVSGYLPDAQRRVVACVPGVQPGLWFHQGWAAGSGLAYEWLIRETRSAESRAPADVPPGSEGVWVMPYWSGRTSPDQLRQRGAILGLRSHHTAGHVVRATLEALAYEFYHWATESRGLGGGLSETGILAVGSAAANDVWLQIKADLLGVPYRRAPDTDYNAIGLGAIARYALGHGALACPGPDPNRCSTYRPDAARGARYRELAQTYLDLANRLDGTVWSERGMQE